MSIVYIYKELSANRDTAFKIYNVNSFNHQNGCLYINTNCDGIRGIIIIPDKEYALAECER